jgi:hypothetical protein
MFDFIDITTVNGVNNVGRSVLYIRGPGSETIKGVSRWHGTGWNPYSAWLLLCYR